MAFRPGIEQQLWLQKRERVSAGSDANTGRHLPKYTHMCKYLPTYPPTHTHTHPKNIKKNFQVAQSLCGVSLTMIRENFKILKQPEGSSPLKKQLLIALPSITHQVRSIQ